MIDYTTFIPVIGYPIAQKKMLDDLDEGKISFEEAAFISAGNSAIYAGSLIWAAQSNYLAAKQFQRLGQAVIATPQIVKIVAPAVAFVALGTSVNEATRERIGSKWYSTPYTSGFGSVV